MTAGEEAEQRQAGQDREPRALVEMRQQLERLHRFDRAHASRLIAREHTEAIRPGWNVRVVGRPPRSGLDPVPIETVQPILEGHLLTGGERHRGKLELELAVAGRTPPRLAR